MADKVTNYQCPACTGPLHFDSTTGKLKVDGDTNAAMELIRFLK